MGTLRSSVWILWCLILRCDREAGVAPALASTVGVSAGLTTTFRTGGSNHPDVSTLTADIRETSFSFSPASISSLQAATPSSEVFSSATATGGLGVSTSQEGDSEDESLPLLLNNLYDAVEDGEHAFSSLNLETGRPREDPPSSDITIQHSRRRSPSDIRVFRFKHHNFNNRFQKNRQLNIERINHHPAVMTPPDAVRAGALLKSPLHLQRVEDEIHPTEEEKPQGENGRGGAVAPPVSVPSTPASSSHFPYFELSPLLSSFPSSLSRFMSDFSSSSSSGDKRKKKTGGGALHHKTVNDDLNNNYNKTWTRGKKLQKIFLFLLLTSGFFSLGQMIDQVLFLPSQSHPEISDDTVFGNLSHFLSTPLFGPETVPPLLYTIARWDLFGFRPLLQRISRSIYRYFVYTRRIFEIPDERTFLIIRRLFIFFATLLSLTAVISSHLLRRVMPRSWQTIIRTWGLVPGLLLGLMPVVLLEYDSQLEYVHVKPIDKDRVRRISKTYLLLRGASLFGPLSPNLTLLHTVYVFLVDACISMSLVTSLMQAVYTEGKIDFKKSVAGRKSIDRQIDMQKRNRPST
ncbi:hypothetical protein CSUI_006814 [Cystoisospora suis]|uniref:Transmembrane protein n=1 Tax=Cystoisospora suis TaxID=483139 RepID=A0A2C6KFS7_9APIC|nr:hypothetical protein CSUI_006814 [Cystoisospora suis]